ncbi:restriction endonuclease subunit S [Micromonospora chalcea]
MRSYRIKDVARINARTLPESTDPEYRFRYIDIGSVDSLGNITIPKEETSFATSPSRARRLAPPRSVIVSTVRTYLRAVAFVPTTDASLVFSTGFAVLEATDKIDPRFLAYHCQSEPFIGEVVARSVGVSYPAINASEIGNLPVRVPNFQEQHRLGDFLDAATAQIDRVGEAMRRQVDVLTERRLWALDSAWPALAATTKRLGYGTQLVTSGSRGWADFVGNIGSLFFRSANLRRDSLRPNLTSLAYVELPSFVEAEASRSRISEGDVLVGITGANTGWVALADDSVEGGNVSQHVCLVRPKRGEIHGKWLAYLIASPTVQSRLMGSQYGGTKTQLSLPDLRDLRIPVIPFEEQKTLAAEVDEVLEILDKQRGLRNRQLGVLAERRQALITAAVTGQIDVSTASGRGIED